MRRITVTIRDEVARALEEILANSAEYRKRSHVVEDALEQFIRINYPELLEKEERTYPSILWKLRVHRRHLRGPSPRIRGRKAVGEWRIVDVS
jgi:metal-responsive CopG/Arc/MetJ family transcriptional regulator